jgi:molybdate transport repressor ModE-like protein
MPVTVTSFAPAQRRAAPPPAWAGVQHRHLASLSAIAREGSFRGAARTLGYSQSALSQHVAHLERVLGVSLLARRRGSAEVELTAAGELLLDHVDGILAVYRAAEADLDALASRARRVRIGVGEALAPTLLPRVLPAFAAAHPDVAIDITHFRCGADLAAALADGRLDIGIGDPPERRSSLATRPLAPEPYVLAAPAAWPVVRAPGVRAADLLEHLPLVRADDPAIALAERELRARGLPLPAAGKVAPPSAVPPLVACGAGAAILPAGLVPAGEERIVRLPLDGLVSPRAVAVAWRGERRAAALVTDLVARVSAARPAVTAPLRAAA